MADASISLETKLKVTGVQVAKGVKAADLKAKIDIAAWKKEIAKAKDMLSKAVSSLRVQPQIHITKTALAGVKRQIREGLAELDVGKVKAGVKAGKSGGLDTRVIGRINRSLATLADSLRGVNRGMSRLRDRLNDAGRGGRGGRRGGGGGGGAGGGPPVGGGGGFSGGGGGGILNFGPGDLPVNDFMLLISQVPNLDKAVAQLGKTFQQDVVNALVNTGKAGQEARARLGELIGTQERLSRALGRGPKSPEAVLGAQAQKGLRDEIQKNIRIAREADQAFSRLGKVGKTAANTAQKGFLELRRTADKLGVDVDQLAKSINRVFGGGRGGGRGGGGGIDFGSFFGEGGSFEQFKKTNSALVQANNETTKFSRLIEEVGRKAAVFRVAAIAINGISNALKSGVSFLFDFEGRLRDVNKILQLTTDGVNRLGNAITRLAADTGVAATDIAGVTEELARAGLAGRGFGSILELTDRILTGVQGTTLNSTEATEFLIQTIGQLEAEMKGLNNELVTTSKGFDVLGRAEDITASKASDVVNAFKRSGASLLATGATFEEIAALISVTQERTRRGAEVIGTSFKTLATRISNPSSEASNALRSIGVATVDAQGNLRNIFDIIQDTAKAFDTLTEAQQASISATVAGVRQVEIFRNVVNAANRQVDVLAQLQIASGDAARKQAEEQSKLGNILTRVQAQFQRLIEIGRQGGLDQFFRLGLLSAEKLLVVVNFIADTFKGLAGTAAAFLIAKGLKLALAVGTRLVAGFSEFIKSVQTGTTAAHGLASGFMVVGDVLARISTSMGVNVKQAQAWRQEIEGVRSSLAAAQAAQAGGGGPARTGFFGAITGGLNKIGSALTPRTLFAAAAGAQFLSLAADEMGSSLVRAGSAMADSAINGALLGSAFGPMGAAIGGITGAVVGLTTALITSRDEVDKFSELTVAGFNRINESFDQLEFDTFASAVLRANDSLKTFVRDLQNLGDEFVGTRASKVAETVEGIAKDPEFLALGPQERAREFNATLSRAFREAFDIAGDFDIESLTELPGDLDKEQVKRVMTSVISKGLGVPLAEAQAIVAEHLFKLEQEAQAVASKADQLQGSINANLDKFSNFATLGLAVLSRGIVDNEVLDEVDILKSQVERLRGQALDKRSVGGMVRSLSELFQATVTVPQALEEQADRVRRASLGGKAAAFEINNILKGFLDLEQIGRGARGPQTSDLEGAFTELSQSGADTAFSKFANKFRKATTEFISSTDDLQSALEKAVAPLNEMAQVEARLTATELERLRVITDLERTSGRVDLLANFRKTLGKLGPEARQFEDFANKVFGLFEEVGTLGTDDPSEGLKLLQGAAADFAKEAKQLENKELLSATTKLFDKSIDLFIKSETKLANKRGELRRKQIAATKEQITNLQNSTQKSLKSIEMEELRSSVLVDQLSSLDKLVAQEQALTRFTELRSLELQKEIMALQGLASAADITDEQRSQLNKKIAERESELTRITLNAAKKRNDIEKRFVDERVKLARKEASFANTLIDGRARLADLLDEEKDGSQAFTRALSTNQAKLRKDLDAFNVAIIATANSTLPAVEKERRLKQIRRDVAKRTLEAAIAEAEILERRKQAVEELVGEGLRAQDELNSAQFEVMEATKEVSSAFNDYVDAVQGVIAATTEYTVGLQLANIEATKITGGFRGIKDEINATARVFERAEQAALAVGAGEKIIADLRKQSIEQQINLFQELLSAQQQQARSFFTSSREDQAELFRSIQAVQALVQSGIFGDSFNDFSKMGEDAINRIGAELLALPQETRQGLVEALTVLKDLGVEVGGFTADQLQNIIDTVSLGASEDLEVDPLFEIQSRIADLIEEQARLQLDGIIAANEQVNTAKEQLVEARAQKDLAEIQLDRLRENAERIGGKIVDLRDNLRTPILQQTNVIDTGFRTLNSSLTAFMGRLENVGLALTADAGGDTTGRVMNRSNVIRQSIREGSRNNAALAFGTGSATLPLADTSNSLGNADRASNLRNDASTSTTNDLLRNIERLLDGQLGDANTTLSEINARDAETVETASTGSSAAGAPLEAEFNISIEGQQQVRVTGLTEGINTAIQNIINTLGPFVSEEQVRDQVIQPILDQINRFFVERGLPVLNFQ